MLRAKLNQRGEAMMIILLIVVLGAVGGLFYWKYQQVNKNVSKVDTSVPNASEKKKTATTPIDNTKYLTIKEWGVKIPLSAELQDAFYIVDGNDVHFSTVKVAKFGDMCDPRITYKSSDGNTSRNFGLGVVSRIPSSEKDVKVKDNDTTAFSGSPQELHPDGKVIGNYFYYYVHIQAVCSDNDATISQEGPVVSALTDAVKSLSAAQ